jgi:type 1 fimbria pilin
MRHGAGAPTHAAPAVFMGIVLGLSCLVACSGGDSFKSEPTTHYVGNITVSGSVTRVECPKITSYTVSPYKNAAGIDVEITSTADVAFGIRPIYRWAASSGTFVRPDLAITTYRCGDETNPTITLTVSYGGCIDRIWIEELDCT